MTVRYPRDPPTSANPIPVLPAVPSTIVPPGSRQATRLGILDDTKGCTILDRLAGIQEFRLSEDFAPCQFRGPVQADQRRVSHRICQV